MTIKTICLAMMYNEKSGGEAAFDYAMDMAALHKAHLSICVGVPMIIIPMDYPAASIAEIQYEEDERRLAKAQEKAEELRVRATIGGAPVSVDVYQNINQAIFDRFAAAARVHDISITQAFSDSAEFQTDAAQALLNKSGGPVLIIPETWMSGYKTGKIVIAWDGSVQCSRAVRDAIALFKPSVNIELLTVTGEKPVSRNAPWGEIAPHLSAHFKHFTTAEIPVQDANVAKTIQNHAMLNRSDMIVMGCYGHSRLREWIMGGVTREMLRSTKTPLLMAH